LGVEEKGKSVLLSVTEPWWYCT